MGVIILTTFSKRYKLFLEALEDIKGHNEKFKKGEVDVEATPNEVSWRRFEV